MKLERALLFISMLVAVVLFILFISSTPGYMKDRPDPNAPAVERTT